MKQHQTGAYFNLLKTKYPDLSIFGGMSAIEMGQLDEILQPTKKTTD
jgi:hypothetical protein